MLEHFREPAAEVGTDIFTSPGYLERRELYLKSAKSRIFFFLISLAVWGGDRGRQSISDLYIKAQTSVRLMIFQGSTLA